MKKWGKNIYTLLLIFLCLASFVLGAVIFNHTSDINLNQKTEEIAKLRVAPLKIGDIVVKNSYVGHVEAIHHVNIVPYISGYLEKISVQPGQYVNKNDLMVSIEASEYKAKLDVAYAQVLQAQASFDYNKNYYERVTKSGKNAFSQTEIDNAKSIYLQSEASLKTAQANKSLAEINLGYTQIKAPISGLIGNFTLTTGDYVAPNTSFLFDIIQTNPVRVVFSITDKEYLNINENSTIPFKDSVIKLTLANGVSYLHEGQFKYTDNELNPSTNSLTAYAYFENTNNELLPNSYVTVDIFHTFKNSVSLDKNLVKMQPSGNFVNIVRHNKIVQQPVEILSEDNNKYILKNIFQKDDLLVLDNIEATNNEKFNFVVQNS